MSAIRVAAISGKGRGLVAKRDIPPDTVLERAPAAVLTAEECDTIDLTPLKDFWFRHPTDPDRGCIVFGLLSVANHSEAPNCRVDWVHDQHVGWCAMLVTLVAIPEGAELTHRYRATWFEVV